eukprot:3963974-Pyramimonas_sp.AAC.1
MPEANFGNQNKRGPLGPIIAQAVEQVLEPRQEEAAVEGGQASGGLVLVRGAVGLPRRLAGGGADGHRGVQFAETASREYEFTPEETAANTSQE